MDKRWIKLGRSRKTLILCVALIITCAGILITIQLNKKEDKTSDQNVKNSLLQLALDLQALSSIRERSHESPFVYYELTSLSELFENDIKTFESNIKKAGLNDALEKKLTQQLNTYHTRHQKLKENIGFLGKTLEYNPQDDLENVTQEERASRAKKASAELRKVQNSIDSGPYLNESILCLELIGNTQNNDPECYKNYTNTRTEMTTLILFRSDLIDATNLADDSLNLADKL